MAEFVDTFGRLAATPELHKLFFISGGALAVENALKAAFDWKIRKNIEKGVNRADAPEGELRGTKIIHFASAFHGRTGYTLSLTNTFDPRKIQFFPKFDWPRVDTPAAAFPLEGANLDDTVRREQQSLAQIAEAIEANPDDVAAILIEPIQAEGGDNHFRPEFLQALRRVADENDMLLIFDEVQSGMGLTGTMWAYQQMGMAPDILAFGKKAQICGIMASDRLDEIKDNVFRVSSRINSTWGGNLVDMVRCQRYLEIMDDENLLDNARDMGARFLKGLETVDEAATGRITNIRGRGLMCAFDLPTTEMRGGFLSKLSTNGMMALPCGRSTVRFRPPLNVSAAEVDEALTLLEKTAKEI